MTLVELGGNYNISMSVSRSNMSLKQTKNITISRVFPSKTSPGHWYTENFVL